MQISDILRNRWVQTSAISAVTFAAGTGLGYLLVKRHYETALNDSLRRRMERTRAQREGRLPPEPNPFADFLKEEVEEMERLTKLRRENPRDPRNLVVEGPRQSWGGKPDTTETDRLLGDEIDRITEEDRSTDADIYDDDELPINVYKLEDDDWDQEAELSTRTKEEPYVIHQEEYLSEEMGIRQETVTYYVGDDIMADTHDTPIYNWQNLMGELKFGHGTRDPNVVYIRNEDFGMEWEILRNEGCFSIEVLGLELEKEAEDELRHSVQKFRRE
jgi:hypothetical protein